MTALETARDAQCFPKSRYAFADENLPLEKITDFSSDPISFEEMTSAVFRDIKQLEGLAVVKNRFSEAYLDISRRLEKGIAELASCAITKTVFFSAFLEAGIPEEFSKFLIFMLFIWRDKNFDEYFDGIVYASFIGLGFACIENIEYVFSFGFSTGVVRALISVPGHFLFGVVLGYFLSLAKFHSEKRGLYILTGLLLAMLAHGLFDWMLMITQYLNPAIGTVIYLAFIWGDIKLWKLGLKYINKQQENSRKQALEAKASDLEYQIRQSIHGYDSEYKRIDWDAGDKR